MWVIRARELVLDDQDRVVRDVPADKIERVTADSVLCCLQLEVDTKRLCQPVRVREQPRVNS
jgi:hypothetical protein